MNNRRLAAMVGTPALPHTLLAVVIVAPSALACLGTVPELPASHVAPDCSNGADDDGDGHIDFPFDPGCETAGDPRELTPSVPSDCSDGADNDGDGRADFDTNGNGLVDPNDEPGCSSAADDDEANIVLPECSDRADNDGDGLVDREDPHCRNSNDDGEAAECSDGIDNDGDGFVDYTLGPDGDPDCSGPLHDSERPECSDGLDNDGDGAIDGQDTACTSANDASEST